MVAWINQGELIIAEKVKLTKYEPYIGAFICILKINLETLRRSRTQAWLGITEYKLNKMIEFLLSI